MECKGVPNEYQVDYDTESPNAPSSKRPRVLSQEEEEDLYFNRTIEKEYETVYEPCDKKADLFILQQNLFIEGGNSLPSQGRSTCSR